jgi:hypothetical protein
VAIAAPYVEPFLSCRRNVIVDADKSSIRDVFCIFNGVASASG